MPEQKIDAALGMLYLCGCVLNGKKPSAERLAAMSLRDVYGMSRFHSLSALVCEALEDVQLATEEEKQCFAALQSAKIKSVRKNLLLDTERAKLCEFMEQKGIWYMPLKGVILKDMYPKMGLRQMSDNDILFDERHREAIRDWFTEQGYKIKSYGLGNHDVYLKEPVYNYEMHVSLYNDLHMHKWFEYYKNVKEKLVKDEGNEYGYRFTDEDFYIYFFTHGFKHFDGGGTGVRFLIDLYIYLKAKEATMDFCYIEKEMSALGLSEFERNCRALSAEIFDDINAFDFEKLNEIYKEMLLYFLTSGTYGTIEQSVRKGIDSKGKFRYLILRFFPGTDVLQAYHPVFKHKWLMPIGWIYRAFNIMFISPERAKKELKIAMKTKQK